MTWVLILLLLAALAALAALHVAWRRRYRELQRRQEGEFAGLQQQQQRTAREAQLQQQVLFNSMLEGLLLLDRHRRIYLVNRAFEKLFALAGPVQGKTMLEGLRLHELVALVERVETEGQVLDYELRLSGLPERWLQVNAALITNVAGEREGVILVFHDLTRIKQLERTREEFVANVSHELRTPLSMIKGYVETLLGGAREDPATAEKFLQTIERHTNRLTLLIEDLLAISSLESGHMKLHPQPVALPALVDKVFADFKPRAAARGVTLVNEMPPLTAQADADRLHQVLSNLVDNAIKYGRPQGRVAVGGRDTGARELEMSVRDDGPGVPAEAMDRIFERFYRVDKARSRDQGGTGLGLAIVKHIVQAHGGRVWVSSEPGRGASFFFTLPAAVGAESRA